MGLQWSSLLSEDLAGEYDASRDERKPSFICLLSAVYHWVVDPENEEYFPEPHHDSHLAGHGDRDLTPESPKVLHRPWIHGLEVIRHWIEGPEADDPDLAYSNTREIDGSQSAKASRHHQPPSKLRESNARTRQDYDTRGRPSAIAALIAQHKRPRQPSTTAGGDCTLLSPGTESFVGSFMDGPKSLRIQETSVSEPPGKRPSQEPLYPWPDGVPDLRCWEKSVPRDKHSCSHCQLLFFDARTVPSSVESTSRILSLWEISEAAANGCTLFRWLQQAIPSPESSSPDGRHFYLSFISKDNANSNVASVNFTSNDYDEFDHMSHSNLGVYADPGDPAAMYISGRPLVTAVGSNDTVQHSRKWLAECHTAEDHIACRGSSRTHLPARIIRLDGERLYLFEPPGNVPGRYAVLSYSWGGEQPYMTITKNREAHKRSIPFTRLSKTVRDAVITTRGLGLKYIWVDCLCMIQDDKDDQMKQIQSLSDIFQGAFVTISAASASSSSQGFLHDRTPEIVRVPYMLPDGKLGALNLFQEIGADPEPIHTRAWTLQEHVHSCRILEYGSQRLRRICRGPSDSSNGDAVDAGAALRRFDPAKFDKGLWNIDPNPHVILLQYWRPLVKHYTQRKLTYPKDRPLAILGIAREYSKVIKSPYVEGLWKNYLFQDLLWYRHAPEIPRPRHTEQIAPSWSWLSLDGVVIKWRNCESDLVCEGFEINTTRLSDRWLGRLGGDDTSLLRVKGYLLKALWMQETQSLFLPLPDPSEGSSQADSENPIPVATIIADAQEPRVVSTKGIAVECLIILGNAEISVGLVLVRSPQVQNKYRRVGLFWSKLDNTDQCAVVDAAQRWRRTGYQRAIEII
ncbi:heterokaryon incompatibility protein-domain-containing protein [Aspergillus oleicola]